jgi:hypothetical protein
MAQFPDPAAQGREGGIEETVVDARGRSDIAKVMAKTAFMFVWLLDYSFLFCGASLGNSELW